MNEKELLRLAKLFDALSSEQRIDIILKLLENPKCHSDIAKCVPIDVSTVWRHVKKLEEAGIVETKRMGKKVIVYPRKPDALYRLITVAKSLL